MNTYTVNFRYASQMVEATDTDTAAIKAAQLAGEIMSAEDRGELLSITLHGDGDQTFFTAAGEAEGLPREALPDAPENAAPLPPRRKGGLSLSYDSGDLLVSSFGYSASLSCAYHEGELNHDRGQYEAKALSKEQQKIVSEWMDREDDYYKANNWQTWDECNGG